MAFSTFPQGRTWLSFLLVLLLLLQPGQYGKKTQRRYTTTLQPSTTATATSAGCSTIEEKFVIKLNGTEMPGCNSTTDQSCGIIQNCSSPSNCSIPSDRSPIPVTNLKVLGQTNNSITLAWESPPCPASACGTNTTESKNTSCTAHFSNLQPGQNYTIVMYRVTEAGQNISTPISVTTRPSPVRNVVVQNRTVNSLKITWMSPEDSPVYRYNICLSSAALPLNCSPVVNSAYSAVGLEAGTLYTVTVYAVTINDVCSVEADLQAVTLPNEPRNITTKQGSHDVTISWDPPKDHNASAYSYRVFLDQRKHGNTSTSNYTINKLVPGTAYTIELVSVIMDVESAKAGNTILTNPLPPTNFTVTTINQSAVYLSWSPPGPAFSGFKLQQLKRSPEFLDSSQTSFVFSALSPGTKYSFALSTVAEDGNLTTFSTDVPQEGATKPEPVGNIQCFPAKGGYSLNVSWPCVSGNFNKFLLNVSGQKLMEWRNCNDSVEVHNLQPATSYCIQVMTVWNDLQATPRHVECSTASLVPPEPRVVAASSFAVLILPVVLLGLLLFYFWRRHIKCTPQFPCLACGSEQVSEKPKANTGPPCVLASVSVSAFPCYCCEHFSDSAFGFAKEYQQLQDTGTGQPQTVAELPENRDKNRYSNVLPYDSSRVALTLSPGDPNSDYINASYMPGYHREKEYIAAQGPLPGTVHDFWRMIWEQRVTTLVMLTNCVENGRVKCERYWPLDYTPCTYGDITVSVVTETILLDWTIRDFTVKRKNECEVRLARHYHYTSWPDHGVPSVTSAILHFRDLVREHMEQHVESGPALVHCSAGVGRTGTFIALDTLLSQAQKEGRLGVYSFVQRMRMNRPLMIQTESQYVFLHQCLLDSMQPPPPDTREKTHCTAVYENTLAFQDYEVSRV